MITDSFFDLDHTLWDFERNSALTFEEILEIHNVRVDLADFLEVYVPINLHYWKLYRDEQITKEVLRYERLNKTFEELKITVSNSTIIQLSEDYIRVLPRYNHLFNNANEILSYLQPKYKLHIITNGFEEVQNDKLKNSGIAHYFDHIINSESVGVKKPNPLIFEHAMDKASSTPLQSVMIGDNLEADILGARNVGMHTIHFNVHDGTPNEFGITINDLLEIKQYL